MFDDRTPSESPLTSPRIAGLREQLTVPGGSKNPTREVIVTTEDASDLNADKKKIAARFGRWLPDPEISRGRLLIMGCAAAGIIIAILVAVSTRSSEHESPPAQLISLASATSNHPAELVISVVGEVSKPGLVTVSPGARVAEAIQAAGGANPGIDLSNINMARKVADGEQIVVGKSAPEIDGQFELVDLNAASEAKLDELPGVGPITAKRIIQRRTSKGPFTSLSQLGEIDGIGQAKLARLAELVRI